LSQTAVDVLVSSRVRKSLHALASLKVAIPLLVVLTAVTVIGSLFAQPVLFQTWWYFGLLGILGLSLLLITVLHIPRILRRKGRNALIGVIATHAGILVLIVGAMYGSTSSSRWQFRAVEGEMTVVPGMPFVLKLDALEVEEYPAETFAHLDLNLIPKKQQDSRIALFRHGQAVAQITVAPARPGRFEGYRILPSLVDIGWYFELIVTDRQGREKTVPVKPWEPPLFNIGEHQLMAHRVGDESGQLVQVFTLEDRQPKLLGVIDTDAELEFERSKIRLGAFKRYTGVAVYNRPHMPMLVVGVLLMLAGLVWHFYHRYRD